MCFFDSPIARCTAIHEMVLTDETLLECKSEHECPPDRVCPLEDYFVKPDELLLADRQPVYRELPERNP